MALLTTGRRTFATADKDSLIIREMKKHWPEGQKGTGYRRGQVGRSPEGRQRAYAIPHPVELGSCPTWFIGEITEQISAGVAVLEWLKLSGTAHCGRRPGRQG